jgi:nicotinate-nucleotide adenylyltransferase
MAKYGRIGILGGTFNPIHLGHLALAEQAREILHLDKIIFVPTNLPPHKRRKRLSSAEERLQMVSLAVKSHPCFSVSNAEIRRGGVSYSVDTARELRHRFPQNQLYFIVGADFLKEFSTWKDLPELKRICKFVVAQRPGYPLLGLRRNMQVIKITPLDISSTGIRKRIKNKQSIRYLVPEETRRYILRQRLYR